MNIWEQAAQRYRFATRHGAGNWVPHDEHASAKLRDVSFTITINNAEVLMALAEIRQLLDGLKGSHTERIDFNYEFGPSSNFWGQGQKELEATRERTVMAGRKLGADAEIRALRQSAERRAKEIIEAYNILPPEIGNFDQNITATSGHLVFPQNNSGIYHINYDPVTGQQNTTYVPVGSPTEPLKSPEPVRLPAMQWLTGPRTACANDYFRLLRTDLDTIHVFDTRQPEIRLFCANDADDLQRWLTMRAAQEMDTELVSDEILSAFYSIDSAVWKNEEYA